MSGFNSGAEIRKSSQPMLPVKSLVENIWREHGRVHLSCQQVSQMFDYFPYFFTNHAFGILALICNLNLDGLSPTFHPAPSIGATQ
jgi:hypothetical protein